MQAGSGPTGADLQPKLLPAVNNNRKKNTPPLIHAKTPAEKRPREETPSPEKQQVGTKINWHKRVEEDAEWAKGKIGMAAQSLKTDKIVSLAESVRDFMNITLIGIIVRQANTSSDLVSEIDRLDKENKRLAGRIDSQGEEIVSVKLCKEKVEVKTSKKEMEEKIKIAVTQVKVSDVDLGREITDRKELAAAAKEAMAAKIRSDMRKEYDDRIKGATVKILSSRTFKSTSEGREVWTAPILITAPERENRWEIENCLRSSKIFPGFHWPKEMVDNVKVYRQAVRDMGYTESTHFIRIRPEERDGSWKIRADAKAKEGNAKFISVASFDIPPLDESLKKHVAGWATPTWTRKKTRSGAGSGDEFGADTGTAAAATVGSVDIDFAEDDDIQNL
jgi:hypothetical protein